MNPERESTETAQQTDYVTIKEAAKIVGKKDGTIYQWARRNVKFIQDTAPSSGKMAERLVSLEEVRQYFNRGDQKLTATSQNTILSLESASATAPKKDSNRESHLAQAVAAAKGSQNEEQIKAMGSISRGPSLKTLKNFMRKSNDQDLISIMLWICGRLERGLVSFGKNPLGSKTVPYSIVLNPKVGSSERVIESEVA